MRTFYINLIFFISFIIIVLATLGWVAFINQTFPNLHWIIRFILGGLQTVYDEIKAVRLNGL